MTMTHSAARTLPLEIDILTLSGNLSLPIIPISSKEGFNYTFFITAPSVPHRTAISRLNPLMTTL